MSTSFLSPPTGWQNILMTRRSRLSTPVWRPPGRRPCAIWPRNTAPATCRTRCFRYRGAVRSHQPAAAYDAARRGVCRRHARGWASAAISTWWFMTKAICFPRLAPGGCCAPLAWRRCPYWPVGWRAGDVTRLPLEQGVPEVAEGEFDVRFDPQQIKRLTDVLLVSHEGSAQIVDARPAARFNGQADEPRPGLRRGHIPARLTCRGRSW